MPLKSAFQVQLREFPGFDSKRCYFLPGTRNVEGRRVGAYGTSLSWEINLSMSSHWRLSSWVWTYMHVSIHSQVYIYIYLGKCSAWDWLLTALSSDSIRQGRRKGALDTKTMKTKAASLSIRKRWDGGTGESHGTKHFTFRFCRF